MKAAGVALEGWPRFTKQWTAFRAQYQEGLRSWWDLFLSKNGPETLKRFTDTTDKYEAAFQAEKERRANLPRLPEKPDGGGGDGGGGGGWRLPDVNLPDVNLPDVDIPWTAIGIGAAVAVVGIVIIAKGAS